MDKKKHEHGFKTPDDYFGSLEGRLNSLIDQEFLPGKTGFKAPDGYFDSLEDKVLEQISSNMPKESGKVIPFYRNRYVRIVASVAAIVALVILVTRPDQADDFQNIEMAQIESYVEQEMIWDEYDLAQMMEESELEELESEELFAADELQDYLMENIDDTSLLIE